MALSHDVNKTKHNGAQAVAALVAVLVAAGHSIRAYGTGVSGARVGGGADFDDAALEDRPGAWVTVQLAAAQGYVTFQRSSDAAGVNRAWWVSFTRGGLSADGTGATVDPPVALGDTRDVWGSLMSPAPLFPDDDPTIGWRFHCVALDVTGGGPCGWWCLLANPGTGEGRALLLMDPLTVHPSDEMAQVLLAQSRSSWPWVGQMEHAQDVNNAGLRTWHKRGRTGASWARGFLAVIGWAGGAVVPRNLGLNPFDLKDELFQVLHFSHVDTENVRYFKGASVMSVFAGTGRPNQHTFDPDGVGDDRIVVGDLALPWPAGVAAVV